MSIIVAALALGAAPAEPAKPTTPAVVAARSADWAERLEHGTALARSMQPEDVVIGATMKALGQGLAKSLHDNPEIQQIEATYPGFIDRYAAATQVPLEKLFRKRMPELWGRMGEALATNMTVAEIDQAAAFYAGPTGQHLIRLGTENTDLQAYVDAGVKADTNTAAQNRSAKEQMAKSMTGALFTTLGAMSQSERDAFSAFILSPAGQAIAKAGPALTTASEKWMSDDDPDATAAMAVVAQGVMQQLEAAKTKPAKAH